MNLWNRIHPNNDFELKGHSNIEQLSSNILHNAESLKTSKITQKKRALAHRPFCCFLELPDAVVSVLRARNLRYWVSRVHRTHRRDSKTIWNKETIDLLKKLKRLGLRPHAPQPTEGFDAPNTSCVNVEWVREMHGAGTVPNAAVRSSSIGGRTRGRS